MRLAALGLSLILLAAGAGGCGGGDDLTVFAAISLRRPLEEIASAFETQHPDIDVSFSFAGSQWLRFQLEEGARASVFISADDRQMELLAESGLIDGRALVFGRNRLAVAVPEGNPARLETLEDLASPGLRLVWAQEGVPLGAYSRQALAALADRYGPDFPQRVEANVISGEANAEAVTGKVELGEADAAIVYETDARRLEREGATVISIPDVYQPEVSFFAAALRETERLNLARDFVTFLRSAEAQAILIDHGFLGVR
jgi:molybdate transport system substrate-binding protein